MSLNFADYVRLTIPEGSVTKITRQSDGAVLWKKGYVNLVPLSTEADGKTIYNGGLGYKDNTRLNSSAAEVALDGYVVIGYIPVKSGDIVRVKGITWSSGTNTGGYFWTFDSSFTKQKQSRPSGGSQDITFSTENGVVVFRLANYMSNCEYFRFSAYGTGENLVVTVNEEI